MAKIVLEQTPDGGYIWIDSKDFAKRTSGKTLREVIEDDIENKAGWKKYLKGGKNENQQVISLLKKARKT